MVAARVLVLDTDQDRAADIASRARSDQWDTVPVTGIEAAKKVLGDPMPPALVLVERSMWADPGLRSMLTSEEPGLPVIVLTEDGDSPHAVIQQLHLGAMSYIPRNAAARKLVDAVQTILTLSLRSPYRERVREYLRSGSIELELGNDPALIPLIVGYAQRVLEDYGLSSRREQSRVGVAIAEAISNAMIHGNLEVSSELRQTMSDAYFEEIEKRRKTEPYLSRVVQVALRFSQSSLTVTIRDQGKGFDRSALADPTSEENLLAPSGRGVLLMRAYTDALSWNEAGNEVTLTKALAP